MLPRIRNKLIEERGLWALIREDFQNHYRDWTRPGFRAIAVYRFGAWARNNSSSILRLIFAVLHRPAYRFVRNYYGIEIPVSATIGRRFHIGHQNGIVVHGYAIIGDDCVIRQGVTLGIGGLSRDDAGLQESRPVLGNGVDIGAGAMIVGKVRIGDGVKIGPNAVVVMDVPENATVLAASGRILTRQSVAPQPQQTTHGSP